MKRVEHLGGMNSHVVSESCWNTLLKTLPRRRDRMSPTPNYSVHKRAVTVVVFSLRPFPLHHSPSCFDLHRTSSLFSSPDPSHLRLNLVIRKMLRAAVAMAFTTSSLNLSQEVRLNRQVSIYLASAPFGCVLVLASKPSRISFYIWSTLTRCSGGLWMLMLINHALPAFLCYICSLAADRRLYNIGSYCVKGWIMSKYEKKQINNITLPSAFRGCFGLELNYLHLRVITEFLQERGDSQKGLPHAAGGAWSRRAWCQTALCVLSCSVISLNKRTVSARVVLRTLASSPQTELGPRHSYLHLASKVGVFVSQTATKVTLFYIYPAAAAERQENGFKGRERQRRGGGTHHLHAGVVKHFCCILTFTKWRRG